MLTIERWDSQEPAWVLLEAAAAGAPLAYGLGYAGAGSMKNLLTTHDPEAAEVMPFKDAQQLAAWSEGRFYPLPFWVASKLFDAAENERSLRGEIMDYQNMIRGAALPVDHGGDGDEPAKLTIDSVDFEPHEGGGSIAFFELDPRFVVVERAVFDEMYARDAGEVVKTEYAFQYRNYATDSEWKTGSFHRPQTVDPTTLEEAIARLQEGVKTWVAGTEHRLLIKTEKAFPDTLVSSEVKPA